MSTEMDWAELEKELSKPIEIPEMDIDMEQLDELFNGFETATTEEPLLIEFLTRLRGLIDETLEAHS